MLIPRIKHIWEYLQCINFIFDSDHISEKERLGEGFMIIKNFNDLSRKVLWKHALLILEEGLRAADPEASVKNTLSLRNDDFLCVRKSCLKIKGNIHVVGFGKASYKMLRGVIERLGDKVRGGIVITHNPEWIGRYGNVEVVLGNHPIPGTDTINSSIKLLNYIEENVSREDIVIVLISGGGSALFEKPLEPITLNDLSKLNELLLKSGADIYEINAVRKHVSSVKGGKLAKIISPAKVIALIISDVVGDPLEAIASGPTAPDPTTFNDAYKILKRRGIWESIPQSVKEIITKGMKGEIEETPKPGDKVFENVINVIVASNVISLEAMARKARELGYEALILTSMMEGEAREVGKFLASIAKHIHKYGKYFKRPLAILLGGETTVTVKGEGIGGRNQELALSFSIHARGLKDVVLASIGSDGKDGVSDAAGAIVDGETYSNALSMNLDPNDYLERNDSYTILSKLGSTIYTGPTGTNVNDLVVLLIR